MLKLAQGLLLDFPQPKGDCPQMLKFTDLPLDPIIQTNLQRLGYQSPTPIQAQALPLLLKGGDLLGIAQTGTGKTASFALPIIEHLIKDRKPKLPGKPRVLILAPTRELASQIKENIQEYSVDLLLKTAVIFGGVGQAAQVNTLRGGVDILVATPGRLLDLMDQGHIKLTEIEVFVLDEADRMLDMGFIHDIKKIIPKIPKNRQTLLFSATMPKTIENLAGELLKNPKRVEVTPPSSTVDKIAQKVIMCEKGSKYTLLDEFIKTKSVDLALIFSRTKHGANRIAEFLQKNNIPSAAIHGNKSQNNRELALSNFKSGKIKFLVATDIAARGIDVEGVSHVINFDVPVDAESYVHRIGRTARAGREGEAYTFCDETEKDSLKRIEKLIKKILPKEDYKEDPAIKKQRNRDASKSLAKDKPKVGYKFRNKR